MKVLIAEDELVTRTVIARAVTHAGHEVATASDGREMLRVFEEFRPDMLLVDWQMPILNGVDAIRELRKNPASANVFVILVTGINGDSETAEAMEAGIDDYVLKPISAPRLRVVLKLTEARLRNRLASGGQGRHLRAGPTADELLGCFGSVLALDGSGRVTFVSPSIPSGANLVSEPIERVLNATDREAFATASVDAATRGVITYFQAKISTLPSQSYGIQPIFRHGSLVGFLIAESERLASAPHLDRAASA